jgi:NAD(P)-dependent dehydrogenase (short-subunit alcohol dehydrogenase family)
VDFSLQGRAGLVTGAAGGIGRASSEAFGRAGATVLVCDLLSMREEAEQTIALIENAGGQARFEPCDVTSAADCERAVATVLREFGRLDFAHNNAGIGLVADFVETSEADFDRCVAINLKGVWLGMKYQIAQMLTSGGGAIVNTASLAGLKGLAHGAAYSATKHAVVGITKTAAVEYAQRGIRVNAVCPAAIATRMTGGLSDDLRAQILAPQAIKRFGQAAEVASAVVWLCSDEASFVTGIALPVDAGSTAS